MTEQEEPRLDDRLARMFRTFEGPADPQPRPRRTRGPGRGRRALLVTAAAVAVGAVGIGAALLGGEGDRRQAAVPGNRDCTELQVQGRRYVARRVPAGALAVGAQLRARAVLVCDGTRIPDADVARVVGLRPALALARPGERGLVYVVAGRCRDAVLAPDLVACLHREAAAP